MSVSQELKSPSICPHKTIIDTGSVKLMISFWLVFALICFSNVSYATERNEFNWSGFYGGVNVGYGFESGGVNTTNPPSQRDFDSSPFTIPIDPEGVIGGGQLGYNHNFSWLVVGLEADFQGSDMSDSSRMNGLLDFSGGLIPSSFATAESTMDAFGTVRGRLGVSIGSLLLYGTGGWIYGNVHNSAFTSFGPGVIVGWVDPSLQFEASKEEWTDGSVVGGGLEYNVWKNLTVKVEYLYFNMQNSILIAKITPSSFDSTVSEFENNGNIIRIGANWRFWAFD
jgi:outer membrane immunogenic protein